MDRQQDQSDRRCLLHAGVHTTEVEERLVRVEQSPCRTTAGCWTDDPCRHCDGQGGEGLGNVERVETGRGNDHSARFGESDQGEPGRPPLLGVVQRKPAKRRSVPLGRSQAARNSSRVPSGHHREHGQQSVRCGTHGKGWLQTEAQILTTGEALVLEVPALAEARLTMHY